MSRNKVIKTPEDLLKYKGYAKPKYIIIPGNAVISLMREYAEICVKDALKDALKEALKDKK
jgi:hypothetical protein